MSTTIEYVWIVESGVHNERYIVGIYADPTVAMTRYPKGQWVYNEPHEEWHNGLGAVDSLYIIRTKVYYKYSGDPQLDGPRWED